MKNQTSIYPNPRNSIVDCIRGFGLIGVLLANLTAFNDQTLPTNTIKAISNNLDHLLSAINSVFIEWKFVTIFSILFGYSFGLLMLKAESKNINAVIFFSKRMFWLFMLGLIHMLFWWGDILHLYAISGFMLLAFRKCSNKHILYFSIIFMFVVPKLIYTFFDDYTSYFTDQNLQILSDSYKKGSLSQVFTANLRLYYHAFILSGADLRDIAETLGRFLLGYYLLRIHLFEQIESKKKIFMNVLLLTSVPTLIYFIFLWLQHFKQIELNSEYITFFLKVGVLSTSCFYASILTLLFIRFRINRIFKMLQLLGRITLTNYLFISCFAVILFYGIGFGKLGDLPLHFIWLWAACLLIFETVFSYLWQKKYRYGPAEWLWRFLSYPK